MFSEGVYGRSRIIFEHRQEATTFDRVDTSDLSVIRIRLVRLF